jgi:molybdopterin-synthase adenylyltransferase
MNDRYERQSFLGPNAQEKIARVRVGVIGVGGGGSHIVQQLSHIGFQDFTLFDDDAIEGKNLNRLVGGTNRDVQGGRLKTTIARRLIRGLQSDARVFAYSTKWQQNLPAFRRCDLIFSCVDTFGARRDLEAYARRFLIPLVDIGIDVHAQEGGPPSLAGQIILSMPGAACMRCIGFLSEENLRSEAQNYGAAGGRPQVVWPNGVVASTAIGMAVDLITDWSKSLRKPVYLSYDGNRGLVFENNRMLVAPTECTHYPLSEVGAPTFKLI